MFSASLSLSLSRTRAHTHSLSLSRSAFAFGHGLSYTTFGYSGLQVTGRNVSFYLTNTGPVAGSEVAQLYLSYPDSEAYPFKQLRGFEKVSLGPGKRQLVTFALTQRWLSSWDVQTHAFTLNTGTFGVSIGGASDDIKLTGTITV